MKINKIIVGFIPFLLFACKKTDADQQTSIFSSISYNVNGKAVTVTGDFNSATSNYGVSFVHSPATGSILNHYVLTAYSSDGTLLGAPVVVSSFATGTYKSFYTTAISYGAGLFYNAKNYATASNNDSTVMTQLIVIGYSNGRASGTFSGKLARVSSVDAQGFPTYEYAVITGGIFSNVIVNN